VGVSVSDRGGVAREDVGGVRGGDPRGFKKACQVARARSPALLCYDRMWELTWGSGVAGWLPRRIGVGQGLGLLIQASHAAGDNDSDETGTLDLTQNGID